MTNPTCSVTGCGGASLCRGWCRKHYDRMRKHGSLERPKPKPKPPRVRQPCSIDGCERIDYIRGWCVRHYQRWLQDGTPGSASIEPRFDNRGKVCTVDGCERKSYGQGMCDVHRRRSRLTGDVGDPVVPPRSERLEQTSYHGMHERLRRDGSAKRYDCVDCCGAAQHWSYSNSCADELSDKGGRYCMHPECYTPRCIPCHARFDVRQRLAAP